MKKFIFISTIVILAMITSCSKFPDVGNGYELDYNGMSDIYLVKILREGDAGLAFDVVMMQNGKPVWDRLPSNIGALGVSYGFEWGGGWRSFPDYPHFQMTFGQSILQLQKR